jgi:hypothetical protein
MLAGSWLPDLGFLLLSCLSPLPPRSRSGLFPARVLVAAGFNFSIQVGARSSVFVSVAHSSVFVARISCQLT